MPMLYAIIDGLGDRPVLKGKTPLEAAKTPNMDLVAREGICGLIDPVFPGYAPSSEEAALSLLGLDPFSNPGRGPLMAVGLGIEEFDLAARVNLATIKDGIIVDRRAGRIREGAKELFEALNEIKIKGYEIEFRHAGAHRGVLVIRGKNLKPVPGNDPGEVGVPPKPFPKNTTGKLLEKIVKEAQKILETHPVNEGRRLPANYILLRGIGTEVPEFEPLPIKALFVTGVAYLKGIGKLLDADVIDSPEDTGNEAAELADKVVKIVRNWSKYELIVTHIKGPDLYGHDGDARGKKVSIELIDRFLGYILSTLEKDSDYIVLTADHSTPCSIKRHSGDPVPVAFAGPDVRKDKVKKFSERACARGGLGRLRGFELFSTLLDYL